MVLCGDDVSGSPLCLYVRSTGNVHADHDPWWAQTLRQPTYTALRYWFDYLPSSGFLVWKRKPSARVDKGDVAGYVDTSTGYRRIHLGSKAYSAHRLVWVWHGNKYESSLDIDHINGVKDDNRIENLRQCTHSDNLRNRKPYRKLTAKNVTYKKDKKRRPWYATIKGKHIGSYGTQAEAEQAVECYLTNNGWPDVRESSGSVQAS